MSTTSRAVVETYSGHTYAQEPRAVVEADRRLEVETVLRRWREPDGPAFLVRLSDGSQRTLLYDESEDCWRERRSEP